jgi:threonylcarbamoyladenosine tRNA methylthiotransferase MtaB
LERLRLSSVEPWSFREEWLPHWNDSRLCRHLHLPLQSGSDAVLRRMNRPCGAQDFAALARTVQAAVPGLALTTDIIVGFPGETEYDHKESLALVESVGFARTHVFPFSPRPGTPAAGMAAQMPHAVVRRRCQELRAVAARATSSFALRFVGETASVLWEQRRPDGQWTGLTDNYLRVYASTGEDLRNRITPTLLDRPAESGMWGQVVGIDKDAETLL